MISQAEDGASGGFNLFHYLRLAMNIVCWDRAAIQQCAIDPNSGSYGAAFWLIAATVIELPNIFPWIPAIRHVSPEYLHKPAVLGVLGMGFIGGIASMAAVFLIQVGGCHFISKLFFGAKGTLKSLMRPLLLGWIVNVLVLIPMIGGWVSGLAWTAVMVLVFREIDGVSGLQALGTCVAINVASHLLLQRWNIYV